MYFTDQNADRTEFSTKTPDNMEMLIKSLILIQTTQNLVKTLIIGDTSNLYRYKSPNIKSADGSKKYFKKLTKSMIFTP